MQRVWLLLVAMGLVTGCSTTQGTEVDLACAVMDSVMASSPSTLTEHEELLVAEGPDARGMVFRTLPGVPLSQGRSDLNFRSAVHRECGEIVEAFWASYLVARDASRASENLTANQATNDSTRGMPKPAFATARISRSDLGGRWPLTVDAGTLVCERQGSRVLVTFLVDGSAREYALNASAERAGRPEIHPIWANDPKWTQSDAGIKMSITPLRARALELCN